ncbi:hypothetical protein B0H13DRAFT_2047871 [Mycena leptocephala]|nr:hypothetical protein B0H13DRAFT_2047871 [Mycena leptocephala]
MLPLALLVRRFTAVQVSFVHFPVGSGTRSLSRRAAQVRVIMRDSLLPRGLRWHGMEAACARRLSSEHPRRRVSVNLSTSKKEILADLGLDFIIRLGGEPVAFFRNPSFLSLNECFLSRNPGIFRRMLGLGLLTT